MDENSLFISAPADFLQNQPPQQSSLPPTTLPVQNPTSNVINQATNQNLGQNTTSNVTNSAHSQNPTSNVAFSQEAGREFLAQNPPLPDEANKFSNLTYKDRLVQAINKTKLMTLQEIAAIEQHLQSFSLPNTPTQNRTQNVGFSQVHNSQTQAPTSTQTSDVSQLGSMYTNNSNGFDSSANVGSSVDLTPELLPDNPARSELKTYIAQNCSHLEPAEIGKILELVRSLETQAVAAFQKKSLEESNRRATDKLSTDSFSSKPSAVRSSHTFTRAEIANMSVQEFRAKKAEIYEQCAKGLVK